MNNAVFWIWRRVDLVWTDVSEELIASNFRVEKSASQRKQVACSSLADCFTLKMQAIRSSETSVHTRSTRHHIPENGILHSHRRENLKFYIVNFIFQQLTDAQYRISQEFGLNSLFMVLHEPGILIGQYS
jgi:hypothetical protein